MGKTINELGAAGPVSDADLLEIWQGADPSKKIAVSGLNKTTGPAAATDNAVARYDGATGKLLQNSALLVSDAGAVLAPDGTATDPAQSFASQTTTGWYYSSNVLRGSIGGTERFRFDSNSEGRFYIAGGGTFPGIVGLSKGATVVNISPDIALDADTGIGSAAADKLSLIAGATEVLRAELSGGAAKIGVLGKVATPAAAQTGGAATAGVVYTATEQTMLQVVYDALRTFGFIT